MKLGGQDEFLKSNMQVTCVQKRTDSDSAKKSDAKDRVCQEINLIPDKI